jgi:translocation and assembly module TamB
VAVLGTLGLAAVLVLALLALRTEPGRAWTQRLIVGQVSALFADDAEVSLGGIGGSLLSGALLVDLEVARGGEAVLHVDTLDVNYSLWTLLRRTFAADRLTLSGVTVVVRQRADSTFNTKGLLLPRPPRDTTGPGFTILLADAQLRRGRAEIHWLHPTRDSVHVVDSLTVRVTDLVSSRDELSGTIDMLDLVAVAPFDAARMHVTSAGSFTRERLTLRRFAASSTSGTQLDGSGRVDFAGDALPVFDASVAAAPLALDDARAFAGLALTGRPRLTLAARSDGRDLEIDLDAALGDAALVLDATHSRDRDGDGPMRTRAEGTLRNLNPAAFTGNPAHAALLTGDLRVAVEGRTLEELTGPFRLALRESRVGTRAINRLVVDGTADDGLFVGDIDADIPGAVLTASARVRPFASTPQIVAEGRAAELDLARLLPGTVRREQFAGDFAVVGQGTSLETFNGTVAVGLDRAVLPLRTYTLRLGPTEIDGTLRNGVLTFDADARLADGGGRAVGSGTLDLIARPLPLRVEQARAENLDLAALLGRPLFASRLNGAFSLTARGLNVRQDALEIDARLTRSTFGDVRIDGGDVQLAFRDGRMEVDADADLGPGGALTARGTLALFELPQRYDLAGTARGLDLAEITGNPAQSSDITGRYTIQGRGFAPATLAATATLQLEDARYGDQIVDAADLDLSLRSGAYTVRGDLALAGGEGTIDASGRLFGPDRSIALGGGTCVRRFDAGPFVAGGVLRTSLSGCFEGRVDGLTDLQTASGSGVLTLQPSTVNEAQITSGRIAFDLARGALGGTAMLALEPGVDSTGAALPPGRFFAAVQGRPFDDTPSLSVRGRADAFDAGALLDLPPDSPAVLTGTFDLSADGLDLATMDLSGTVRGGRSTVGPVRVDTLQTRFALSSGVLRVDTLALASDLAVLDGAGTIALFEEGATSDFRLRGTVESLAPLGRLLDRPVAADGGAFDLTATGLPGEPLAVRGTLSSRRLVVGTARVETLDGRLDLRVDRAGLDSLGVRAVTGTVVAAFSDVATETQRVETGTVSATLDADGTTLDASVRLDDRRDFDLFARIETGSTPTSYRVERGRVTLDGDTWRLLQPARISIAEGLVVDGLELATDDASQRITADGRIRFDGEQDFRVTVENLQLGSLSDLVSLDAVDGALSGELALTGPADAPVLAGSVRIPDLATRGEPVGSLRSDVSYEDGRLGLDATLTHVTGPELFVRGFIPQRFSLRGGFQSKTSADDERVRLQARADSFPIAWAQPLVERTFGYTDLGGALTLRLVVGGTRGAPRIDGTASLRDGQIGVPATGLIYRPLLADITFEGNQLLLDDVRIERPDGTRALDVTGDITLRELSVGEFNLTLTPRRLLAMDTRTYDGLVLEAGSTPLRLTGTIPKPVLRGSVVLAEGDIRVTDELVPPDLEPVTLTPEQIRDVEARFGRVVTRSDTADSRFLDALDYDLTVEIRRNVWIRSTSAALPFDIEFSGDVQARKAPFAEESELYGTIELVRGSVSTLNRRFEVDRGTLTFNGPALGAEVNLGAKLDIRLPGSVAGQTSATINLAITGPLDQNPEIRLTSDPVMDPTDIVSLIATGQLSDQFVGGGALTGALTGALFGQLSGVADRLANQLPGLDLVQIDIGEDGELVVRLGTYFTERLFATVGTTVNSSTRRDRSSGGTLFTLDYQLLQWLRVQTEARLQNDTPDVGGGLSAEIAW